MTNTKLKAFFEGARDTSPLVLAAAPFGMLYGAMAAASDLSIWTTMSMSLFVFAGSSQFVAVNMLMTTSPVLMIILATFFVNLRHFMYSANLIPHVRHLSLRKRASIAFWLTDETFASLSNRMTQPDAERTFFSYYLGSALSMYINWQLCSYLGFVVGQGIQDPLSWGLDIAMAIAFIGVVAPRLNNQSMWACALTAFVCACLTRDWPYNSGLIVSMLSAIAVGMVWRQYREQRHA